MDGIGLLSLQIEKMTIAASLDDVIRIGKTEFLLAAKFTLEDRKRMA
jgi:hypothetical protein